MNKVLNNYRKSKRLNGTSKGKIGTPLYLLDKNREILSVGDTVRYEEHQYDEVVGWLSADEVFSRIAKHWNSKINV